MYKTTQSLGNRNSNLTNQPQLYNEHLTPDHFYLEYVGQSSCSLILQPASTNDKHLKG